jgi:hypothetical protein
MIMLKTGTDSFMALILVKLSITAYLYVFGEVN